MKNILIIILLMVSCFTSHVAADDVTFAVTPVLEADQSLIDQTITAKYNAKQVLTFNVTNQTDHDLTINIKTALPDLDSKGNQTFSNCDTFLNAPSSLTLGPSESQELTISYKSQAFKKDFDGEIANAIIFSQDDQSSIYMLNVRKNDQKDTENFVIETAEPTSINQDCYIRILLKNDSNTWLNQVKITSQVTDVLSDKSETHWLSRMAPNSKSELLIPIPEKFSSGLYTTHLTVEHGNHTWDFENKITLTEAQVQQICGDKVPYFTDKNLKTIYLTSFLFVLLLLTIFLQFRFIQKNNRI